MSSLLENGATEVVIHIRSNRTHMIDGELGLKSKKFGFELGGMSHHSGATGLHIAAFFPAGKRSSAGEYRSEGFHLRWWDLNSQFQAF